jgi:hypothetical protein
MVLLLEPPVFFSLFFSSSFLSGRFWEENLLRLGFGDKYERGEKIGRNPLLA